MVRNQRADRGEPEGVVVSQAFPCRSQGCRDGKPDVFDGADYFVTVWLNGQLLGSHEGTFTAFAFDVTDKLRYGADNYWWWW